MLSCGTAAHETTRPARSGRFMYWVIPILLAILAGMITIDGGFVQDDIHAIVGNPIVTGKAPVSEFLDRDYWGASVPGGVRVTVYRPILPLLWRVIWSGYPGSPLPFRILSMLFHLAATVLVMVVGSRFIRDRAVVWITGCLFAVHAVHAESIGGIVSQADILSAALGLAAILIALGRPRFLTACALTVTLGLACLIKESAVVFCAAIVLMSLADPGLSRRERLYTLIPALANLLAITVVQLTLPRDPSSMWWANNIACDAHGFKRLLLGLYLVGRATAMSFIPTGLSPTHSYGAVDLETATLLPYAIPGLLFLTIGSAALVVALRRRDTGWLVALCLLFGPILLQSNLIVVIGTDLAERLLYTSSMASCAITAVCLRTVLRRKRLCAAGVGLAVGLLSVQSWQAQRPWHDAVALFYYAVASEPLSWRAQYGCGQANLRIGRPLEGAWHMGLARYIVSQYPNSVDFAPLASIADLPLDRRVIEAPAALRPKSPCDFAVELLYLLHEIDPQAADQLKDSYARRYGDCVLQKLKAAIEHKPRDVFFKGIR
jgi:hypothetical protein